MLPFVFNVNNLSLGMATGSFMIYDFPYEQQVYYSGWVHTAKLCYVVRSHHGDLVTRVQFWGS